MSYTANLKTKRDRVLFYLFERAPRWVPGYELTTKEVGGGKGLERLREARLDGWPVEGRKMKGESAWEYRLNL
jgi:hypothetical protein